MRLEVNRMQRQALATVLSAKREDVTKTMLVQLANADIVVTELSPRGEDLTVITRRGSAHGEKAHR